MNPLAKRRIGAYVLDMAGYLGVAALTVPLGMLAAQAGLGESPAFVVTASAVHVVIATAIAAHFEAKDATWGKRRCGLKVVSGSGGRLPFISALGRNLLKIGLPWQVGHVVAIGAAFGGFESLDPALMTASAACYALIGLGIWGVLRRSGVTFYDAATGSRVIPAGTVSASHG